MEFEHLQYGNIIQGNHWNEWILFIICHSQCEEYICTIYGVSFSYSFP